MHKRGQALLTSFPLYQLCDVLIVEGDSYDNHKKNVHEFDDRVTISVYFPFLHNVKCLLLNIGFHGVPTENAGALNVGNNIFNMKTPISKSIGLGKSTIIKSHDYVGGL